MNDDHPTSAPDPGAPYRHPELKPRAPYVGTYLDRTKSLEDHLRALRFGLWMQKAIHRGMTPVESLETVPDHLLLYLVAKKKEEQAA